MSESFEIDLDGEQILFDGAWFSQEELARKIKTMVEVGDYRVSRPSAALESLQAALSGLRTLSLRVPTALADALSDAAARTGQPIGAFVRDALQRSVGAPHAPPAPTKTQTQPFDPGLSLPPPPPPPSSFSDIHVTVTEPVSPAEAAGAIPLVPKRKEEKETDVEKGWFTSKR